MNVVYQARVQELAGIVANYSMNFCCLFAHVDIVAGKLALVV